MDQSRYGELFRSEAREHLGTMTRLLLLLEREPGRTDVLEEIFRSVHTLKGSSAAMGYETATELAHGLEHLLSRLRNGSVGPDAATVDLLLQGTDALERAIENPRSATPSVVLDRLTAYAEAPSTGRSPPGDAREAASTPLSAGPQLRVRVLLERDAVLPAVRATMALRAVRQLAEVIDVHPPEAQITAGNVEGTFSFGVLGGVEAAAVEAAVRGVGEIESVEVAPESREARRSTPEAGATRAGPIVRVPQARLDSLLDQVGELMIARDRLRRLAGAAPGSELEEALGGVSRQIDDLREEAMRLRMVPVGEVFDRFPRLVRDAARALGRQVELEIIGQEEEVDRALLNEVADLMVHLLRNAVDHGIEPPAERISSGKAPVGRIRVSATREGSTVRVEVSDDGRGLQRERILRMAAARGLIDSASAELTESEIWRLLTTAGFSTSETITDVSGRGVGLDVVRSRAQTLGGSLEIRSDPGRGSSFALRLPLSLTLVRALRFEAGGGYYSVPLSAVTEVAEVAGFDGRSVLIRGEELPALDLRELFARERPQFKEVAPAVIVVEFGGERAGLIVDSLDVQHQAVVKPFDAPRQMLDIFSGATILPDGRPSLILDAARAVRMGRMGRREPSGAA